MGFGQTHLRNGILVLCEIPGLAALLEGIDIVWLDGPDSTVSFEDGDDRRHGSPILDLVEVQRCADQREGLQR